MKNKKALGVTVASALALALCGGALVGCGGDTEDNKPLDDKALQATKIADYETGVAGDRSAVFATDGYENGDVFNTWWNRENVSFDNNVAELSISAMDEKEQVANPDYDADEAAADPDYDVAETVDCRANYYGGELRTSKYYGYGDYEVSMKPSGVSGTASTFFVCTGDYDVNYETGIPNPHDEIDIEFLGYDTTKVQFNYFVNGVGGHEKLYDLGFDASEAFHTYGFRWTSEYIVWFVDGTPVYKVTATSKNPMPSTPGRILTNYWTGTAETKTWMKDLGEDYVTGKSQYKYIATSAEAQNDPTIAPPPPPVVAPEEGWADIDYTGFDGWGTYTVDKTEGLNISHAAAVGSYAPCGMTLDSNYSWVKFKVKNNSQTNTAYLRFDVNKADVTNAIVGVASDYAGASYSTADKAAIVVLAAGDTAEVACKISDEVTVNQILVFLNNIGAGTATAGDITISELKGIAIEDGNDPVIPTTENTAVEAEVLVGDNKVSFEGTGYIAEVSEDDKTLTLSYENLAGNGYKNIVGDVSEIIGDNNVFNFKLVNSGEATAKVRIDIKCKAGIYLDQNTGSNSDFCNVKPTYTALEEGDLVGSGNDYNYGGGDWLQIKAGGTVTGKILFKAGEDVGPNKITFFIDSSTYDDATKHTGSIVLSDMSFSKEEVVEVQPTLPEGEGWTAIVLPAAMKENSTNGIYTSETSANSVRITHSEVPVATSSLSTDITYGSNNKVHMKIRNNLDAAYAMRVNAQITDDWHTNILSAEIVGDPGSSTLDTNGDGWNGITVNLGANDEIVLEFTIGSGVGNLCFGVNNMNGGAATGDVTISEICMKFEEYVAPPVEGATLPAGEGWTAIDLSKAVAWVPDGATNTYTVTPNSNSMTITHTALPAATGNVNVNPLIYGENRIVHFKLTNNHATADATVVVLAQNTQYYYDTASGVTVVSGSATVDGTIITIAAGQTAEIEFSVTENAGNICFGVNNAADSSTEGDITISELAMRVSPLESEE